MHYDCAFFFEQIISKYPLIIRNMKNMGALKKMVKLDNVCTVPSKTKIKITYYFFGIFSSLLAPQAFFGAASFQKMFNLDYEEKQFVNDLSLKPSNEIDI